MMKIICKMKFGSHLYGTNTPSSDIDYKGVFLPSIEDCIHERIPKSISNNTGDDKSKNTSEDIDSEIYSLQYFIELACKGETASIDMIHCNKENLIESSYIWEEIVKNRSKLYTRNLSSFIGYARKQAAKYSVKGSRLNTCEEVLKFLKGQPECKLQDIWHKLPRIEHVNILSDPKNKDISFYQVCGKKFQSTARVEYIIPILEKFLMDYGERARLAKENKNVDFKAFSHAVRAALQVKEILTTGDLIFPLRDAKLLTDIKQGKLDCTTVVIPILEELMDEVEELSTSSKYPDEVNRKFWELMIDQAYMENK